MARAEANAGTSIMNRIRLGLVGLGEWPRQAYVPVLKTLEDVEICAVAAKSAATRQYAREQFGQQLAVYADYRELLHGAAVEAVALALPNPLHAEALEAAVASGKHLFYEPPIAHDAGTIGRILGAMETSSCIIQPDLELRCLPVIRALGECLRAGRIGEPLMASVRLWCNWGYGGGRWNYNPEREGFFPWLGCWYLDLLDYVLAALPERVTVTGGYAANGRLMDHGWAALECPGGRIGRFEFNLVAVAGLEVGLSVLGSRGEAEADVIRGNLRWREGDGTWHETPHPPSLPACGFVGMRECLVAFLESIRSGARPEADVEVAGRIHAAMLACAEAEATRAIVSVKPLR
jgi:predicted dehydrogenase